jgi:hypothetical protein
VDLPIAVGHHYVTLINDKQGIAQVIEVEVEREEHKRLVLDLRPPGSPDESPPNSSTPPPSPPPSPSPKPSPLPSPVPSPSPSPSPPVIAEPPPIELGLRLRGLVGMTLSDPLPNYVFQAELGGAVNREFGRFVAGGDLLYRLHLTGDGDGVIQQQHRLDLRARLGGLMAGKRVSLTIRFGYTLQLIFTRTSPDLQIANGPAIGPQLHAAPHPRVFITLNADAYIRFLPNADVSPLYSAAASLGIKAHKYVYPMLKYEFFAITPTANKPLSMSHVLYIGLELRFRAVESCLDC